MSIPPRDGTVKRRGRRGGNAVPTGSGATLQAMSNSTAVPTAMAAKLECDLLAARKCGDCVAYLVPFGPDYTQALAVAQALIDRLRERGLHIRVDVARADNGVALLLEDVTPMGMDRAA